MATVLPSPGKRGRRVVARALAQVARLRALDDDHAQADRGRLQPPDRLPVLRPPAHRARLERELEPGVGQPREDGLLGRGGLDLLELLSSSASLCCSIERVDGRGRLLPQQRQHAVGEQQRCRRRSAGPGEEALDPHRRSADSVPPSEPGPAYVRGPRVMRLGRGRLADDVAAVAQHAHEQREGAGERAERRAPPRP